MASETTFGRFGWMDFGELKRHWGWFLALGICLIMFGVVAIAFSVLATIAYVVVFGWLLVLSGVLQAIHAFVRKKWGGFFLGLFGGILSLVVGIMLVVNPVLGAESLTLLVASFLLVGGVFRIVASLTGRFQNWGWLLLNGIINVVLGALIWAQWPLSGLWVIGLFVGIDMLFNCWSLVMLGLIARRMPEHAY